MQREEKREFIRVPFTTEVEIRLGDRSLRSSSEINISLNGLHMAAELPVPDADGPCEVRILLQAFDHQVVIEALGRVVRAREGHLAVEFTELDPDSYFHLRQLIVNNAADPARAEEEFDAHWGIRRPPSKSP